MATQRKEVVTACPGRANGLLCGEDIRSLSQTLHNWLKRRSSQSVIGGHFSGARSGKCTLIIGLHLYWQISSGLA